ncbi:MAG: sodium:proton antiporter, partial [Cyanobacteria bacterium J083]
MLSSIIWILLGGFLGGEIVRRFAIPPLVGMILVGFLLSPAMGNRIDPTILEMADQLRTISVMVILLRAGLGLDWDKLKQQGSVAIRLGVLPALSETIVIAIAANFLFGFDLLTGLLLGCIVSAESPAVIVPGMLRLKNLGWGVSKGIPDAILTGSALSDVFIFVLFGLLLNLLQANNSNLGQIWLLPINMITQILLGVFFGFVAAIIGLFCV